MSELTGYEHLLSEIQAMTDLTGDERHPIPDYDLLQRCGEGGYGEVWTAQGLDGKKVVVKILKSGGASDDESQGLQTYAKLPASDYRVQILHVGEIPGHDSVLYYVMEPADNLGTDTEYKPATLTARLQKTGRMRAPEVLELGRNLLMGVKELHDAGMCHRDIKPDNVIFIHGQPKLSDIGLVCFESKISNLSGTPGFIPPEKEKMTVPHPISSSGDDLYATGMLLYCCWTGHPPEKYAENLDIPSVCLEDQSAQKLNDAITRAAARNPAGRFSSVDEFLSFLNLAEKEKPNWWKLFRSRLKTFEGNQTGNDQIALTFSRADLGFYGQDYFNELTEKIREDLQYATGLPPVFVNAAQLDMPGQSEEALRKKLQKCRALFCWYSENYRQDDTCARIRKMWASTGRPVFAVPLTDTGDWTTSTVEMQEPLEGSFFQLTPWSGAKEPFLDGLVENRLQAAVNHPKTRPGGRPVSSSFVGREKELRQLRELCVKGRIPVIRAAGGTGKSELAAAYAALSAELYPEGCFTLKAEGVKEWRQVLLENAEDFGLDSQKLQELPEDQQHRTIITALFQKAAKGALLLILDNVDQPKLLTDKKLQDLVMNQALPENLHILATTREKYPYAAQDRAADFPLENLDDADAVALFQKIGGSAFPELTPGSGEYTALTEIIHFLEGHVWALEIAAGYLAQHYQEGMTFQKKLEKLKQEETVRGESGYRHRAENTAELLAPTLTAIGQMPLGKEILGLGTAAAMFPPEEIPVPVLQMYWKKRFPQLQYADGDPALYAWHTLTKFHLIQGEKGFAKMHRLTRQVFLQRMPAEEQYEVVEIMRQIAVSLNRVNDLRFGQITKCLAGWCRECQVRLPELQKNLPLIRLAVRSGAFGSWKENILHQELEYLLRLPIQAETLQLTALCRNRIGTGYMWHQDHQKEAENEFLEILKICDIPAFPEKFVADFRESAYRHLGRIYDRCGNKAEAEKMFRNSLEISRKYHIKSFVFPETCSSLADLLEREERFSEAADLYQELLSFCRTAVAEARGEAWKTRKNRDLADALFRLGNLHRKMNMLPQAQQELAEMEQILRTLPPEERITGLGRPQKHRAADLTKK